MLEETHRRIAREIAKESNLGNREAGLLGAGSVSPDSWANFPHHERKELEIIENILHARLLFLEDDDECFVNLGIALHYIQDRWTLRPRISDKHTSWEQAIDSAPILDDQQLEEEINRNLTLPTKSIQANLQMLKIINKGIQSIADYHVEQWKKITEAGFRASKTQMARYYFNSLRALDFQKIGLGTFGTSVIRSATVYRPTNWTAPILDINFAYRISLVVAKAVLTRKNAPEEPWGNIALLKKVISDFLEWVKAVQAPTLYEYLKKLGVSDRIYGWGLPRYRW